MFWVGVVSDRGFVFVFGVGFGFDVVIVDDLSNSKLNVFDKIKKITGKNPKLEIIDLKNKSEVKKLFSDYRFDGIIHFAAHKYVIESVNLPENWKNAPNHFDYHI